MTAVCPKRKKYLLSPSGVHSAVVSRPLAEFALNLLSPCSFTALLLHPHLGRNNLVLLSAFCLHPFCLHPFSSSTPWVLLWVGRSYLVLSLAITLAAPTWQKNWLFSCCVWLVCLFAFVCLFSFCGFLKKVSRVSVIPSFLCKPMSLCRTCCYRAGDAKPQMRVGNECINQSITTAPASSAIPDRGHCLTLSRP